MKWIYETSKGERIYSEPGNRAPGDKRLYVEYQGKRWAHTLELIGAALRAKAHVEDNNYPNGQGRAYLLDFVTNCIVTDVPIKDILERFKIPS